MNLSGFILSLTWILKDFMYNCLFKITETTDPTDTVILPLSHFEISIFFTYHCYNKDIYY